MILWEKFDINEIFILVMLVIVYGIVLLLPKRLPRSIFILSHLWGMTSSTFFDFTIGGGLVNFYIVNDSEHYCLFDFLTYILFAPFSYFFVYFYELFNIRHKRFIWYVLAWAFVGLGTEWLASVFHVTHYQHGYKIPYSLPIFLFVQTLTGLFYELIKRKQRLTPICAKP